MWDFLPVNLNEIKQIEVIRGPASAVWGANAFHGVVNVISKSPREIQGTSVTVGLGTMNRSVNDDDPATAPGLLQRHARAGHQRSLGVQAVGRRIFAGRAAAADRTDSRLRRRARPIRPSRTPARRSPSSMAGSTTTSRTAGRRRSPAALPAPKASCTPASGPSTSTRARRWAMRRSISAPGTARELLHELLDGNASNLLTRDVNFQPIAFDQDQDLRLRSDQRQRAGKRNVLSYGGNLRFNNFDLSLAPDADNRTEFGVYGRTRSSFPTTSGGSSAAASIASTTSTTSCSRRARRS